MHTSFIVLIAFIKKTVYNGHCWSLNKNFLLLFKIFWKVQNYAETIVRPNGPKQSWVAGHHPYDPTKNTTSMEREFSIRNVHMIRNVGYLYRPEEWVGKEWAVQKINREIRVMGRKTKD